MKYLIIDDEPFARQGIKLLADQIPWLEYCGEFANPIMAQSYINDASDLDLIFLDIEMPGVTGIQYLREMRPKLMVILTTAYSEYALEAFELEVVDYLLKPVKMGRFMKAVQKAKDYQELDVAESNVEHKEESIYIKADRKFIKLTYAEIIFIKGLKDYVVVHTDDKKYMTAMNIGTIYAQLPQHIFARVSKSYVINTGYIDTVDIDSIQLKEHEIPLGLTYKDGFIKKFVKASLLKR